MPHDDRSGAPIGAFARLATPRLERRGHLGALLGLTAVVVGWRGLHEPTHEQAAIGVALLLVARAVALGRSLRAPLLACSLVVLVAAYAASSSNPLVLEWGAIAAGGGVAGLPRRPPAPGGAADRRHVWALVDSTAGDPLAPFAMRADKSYVFSEDRR